MTESREVIVGRLMIQWNDLTLKFDQMIKMKNKHSDAYGKIRHHMESMSDDQHWSQTVDASSINILSRDDEDGDETESVRYLSIGELVSFMSEFYEISRKIDEIAEELKSHGVYLYKNEDGE